MPARTHSDRSDWWRNRWVVPAFALALGGLVLAAMAVGGNAGDGLVSFAALALVAGVFAFGGRSETVSGLGGPGRDERWALIDLRATAFAGGVLVTALIGAWLWELSQGHDGSPYGQLLGVGGIAYIVAIAVLRRRA